MSKEKRKEYGKMFHTMALWMRNYKSKESGVRVGKDNVLLFTGCAALLQAVDVVIALPVVLNVPFAPVWSTKPH